MRIRAVRNNKAVADPGPRNRLVSPVARLQRTVGNRAVQRMLEGAGVVRRPRIDLSTAEVKKPGPPPTVLLDNWYYKVLGTKEQADAIEAEWSTVENEGGVPLPAHGVVAVRYPNADKWAFRSKAVNGTFFQVQKPGGLTTLRQWVAAQDDPAVLHRARLLFVYVRAHMGDAQGFVVVEPGLRLQFIDVNTPGTSPNCDDVVAAIDQRLVALA